METPDWITAALDQLRVAPCGYHSGGSHAAEPTAFTALALIGGGRVDEAQPHLQWLAKAQTAYGSVPPLECLDQPGWPTPLALIAQVAAKRAREESNDHNSGFDIEGAQQFLLSISDKTLEPSPQYGHNGQLVGWPWVDGTHSWQEPTAFAVLALKSLGLWDHPRTREGVQLLIDRLLVTGGCNYGNTVVLGQRLRPHVEPTGAALLALAGEDSKDPRIEQSLQYLNGVLNAETTPISLSYGLLGMAAHNRTLNSAAAWLEAAYRRYVRRDQSPLSIALLVLASQGANCPLIANTKRTVGALSV